MITIIATLSNMNKKFLPSVVFSAILVVLGGCASTVNTAGSADFACPGMPMGVTCKTPGAVYKSTNGELPVSDFDTPLGAALLTQPKNSSIPGDMDVPKQAGDVVKQPSFYKLPNVEAVTPARPKPVREPAQVMRIWIAPWVDTQDTLHLAQLHYAEIIPRTWTVGKPETKSGAGYVIPHLAFNSIGQVPTAESSAGNNSRPEQRGSDSQVSVNAHPVPGVSSK